MYQNCFKTAQQPPIEKSLFRYVVDFSKEEMVPGAGLEPETTKRLSFYVHYGAGCRVKAWTVMDSFRHNFRPQTAHLK
jgi:hypothetical protein